MTLREMLQEVMSLTRMPVSDKDFIDEFNRAVFDLENKYDTAKRIEKRVITCDDIREEYPLTEGCMGIQRVLTGYGHYCTDYTVRDNNIIFDRRGVYFVYEKLPHERIKNMEDTPTINVVYHYPICKYIASKLLQQVEPERAKDLMADYVLESEQMSANLRKNANTVRRLKAPLFR